MLRDFNTVANGDLHWSLQIGCRRVCWSHCCDQIGVARASAVLFIGFGFRKPLDRQKGPGLLVSLEFLFLEFFTL